ncbi:MAG: tRNA uridine-5-carboxymethylaminomethyl(34) synthesis enzyme MnmG [Candidatus Babeliales bacterium]
MNNVYDVIVVGGGHAGIEAAYAAARLGSKTALITLDKQKIGWMPCNPAIGGIGKGHIVFEVSALGGLMPKLCTKTYLQARMLNTKKGPAVQGLRLQIDKDAYNKLSIESLEKTENLTIHEGHVEQLLLSGKSVQGIQTKDGTLLHAPTVILTTGTFLNGLIHIGTKQEQAGRRGEQAVTGLSKNIAALGLELGRLKTGTPPRLVAKTVDFSKMECQEADELSYLFEFEGHQVVNKLPCYITRTNETAHEIIKNYAHLSPILSKTIVSRGPRYCPSIEDKITRFPDKTSHHIFVEPETARHDELYPNGISTSLPLEVQEKFIRSIAGFEHAEIAKAGYAVEYDFVLPHQLHHTLEVKNCTGLFLAGQINGTTGYEEAAGQGLIAGINAHQKAHGKEPFILSRHESYIGIMIDDLVTLSVDEPYRMFTSRAERRLILRQDNVFYRLAEKAYAYNLINEELYQVIKAEHELVLATAAQLRKNNKELIQLLGRDEENLTRIHEATEHKLNDRAALSVWAELRYEPYIQRELKEIEKAEKYQELVIPAHVDYSALAGLSKELQQKLAKYQPKTIAQAALIPGMTPAAISLLIVRIFSKTK